MMHSELFAEVCSEIRTFRVDKRMFNRQLSLLISTGYIQRDSLDASRYRYIA